MKKNLKFMGLACASLILLGGCGEVPTVSDGSDAVVSFDGIDGISVDTLYNDLKLNYGINTLLTMIDKQVYEAEFPEYMEEALEYASNLVESNASYYGGEEELLAQLAGSFASLDSYENYAYVSYLQNIAIDEYSKSLITEDQIEKYYDEEYYADVELSHILITSDASSTADEDEVAEAEEAAEATAKEVIDLLLDAKSNAEDIEDVFADLASEYSDDSATSTNGGSLDRINYEDYDYTYDEFVDMAISLEDGEFSTIVVETELGFHIILKTETYEKDELEDVTDTLKQTLSDNAMASDSYIILDGLEYYREAYGFEINDDDLATDYLKYISDLEAEIASYYE